MAFWNPRLAFSGETLSVLDSPSPRFPSYNHKLDMPGVYELQPQVYDEGNYSRNDQVDGNYSITRPEAVVIAD